VSKPLVITTDQAENLWTALSIRKNVIETGDWRYSAESAKTLGRHEKVQALQRSQMELLIEIDDLMQRLQEFM